MALWPAGFCYCHVEVDEVEGGCGNGRRAWTGANMSWQIAWLVDINCCVVELEVLRAVNLQLPQDGRKQETGAASLNPKLSVLAS
jgi:hypothetical protein